MLVVATQVFLSFLLFSDCEYNLHFWVGLPSWTSLVWGAVWFENLISLFNYSAKHLPLSCFLFSSKRILPGQAIFLRPHSCHEVGPYLTVALHSPFQVCWLRVSENTPSTLKHGRRSGKGKEAEYTETESAAGILTRSQLTHVKSSSCCRSSVVEPGSKRTSAEPSGLWDCSWPRALSC